MTLPRIAITAGEPAGIGPELVARLAQLQWNAELVLIADPDLITDAARNLGLTLELDATPCTGTRQPTRPGHLHVIPIALRTPNVPGQLNPGNARYVIETLEQAAHGAAAGYFDAVVTAPVHKAVVNDGGIPFTGHTEYFAELTGTDVVMLLVADDLRVALATTHLPLAQVPAAIQATSLERTLRILQHDLIQKFAIAQPRIIVLGLNPHAGEGGHLGREEIDIIIPVVAKLRAEGMNLRGPLPADTGFLPRELAQCDAVLAMYHDQGLPVLKYAGFGHAINVTLGLPWIRTSVDHGTALDLAGKGVADAGSLIAATELAIGLVNSGKSGALA
ncbi:MAG: 4-hydroxythreonine-4-phosphate dehydrogenase PdxA [Pseudomonadota bacterium]|nr:4-hydroxythreonine-4-phosphate dehydrogenase PdxA [Pseudomonadota bacterium]